MASIPAPSPRWYVTTANTIIDFAINGLGANAAYAAIIAAEPWMAGPFIGPIVKWLVNTIIGKIDERVKIGADLILIRFGNDIRKEKYDEAMKPLKEKDDLSAEELKAIKDAVDKLVHRSN